MGDVPTREELIAEIYEAFDDVTREGGVSWNEADAIDGWATPEGRARARETDPDTHWRQLVDDPNWDPFPGSGGFSFMDTAGLRYYLPPTLIRVLQGKVGDRSDSDLLRLINRFEPEADDRAARDKLRCLARFIAFMAEQSTDTSDQRDSEEWNWALVSNWGRYLDG